MPNSGKKVNIFYAKRYARFDINILSILMIKFTFNKFKTDL